MGQRVKTDEDAVAQGWVWYEGFCTSHDMTIAVPPETDMDGEFWAWAADLQEMVLFRGWVWEFSETPPPSHPLIA